MDDIRRENAGCHGVNSGTNHLRSIFKQPDIDEEFISWEGLQITVQYKMYSPKGSLWLNRGMAYMALNVFLIRFTATSNQ